MDSKLCKKCSKMFYRPMVVHEKESARKYPLSITLWNKRLYCSNKCSSTEKLRRKNSQHGMWKGIEASYSAIHRYIKRLLGTPKECSKCGVANKPGTDGRRTIQWANIDHTYTRDISKWIALCILCHFSHDRELGLR